MSENSFYYNLYSPYYVFTTHLEAVYRHGGSSAFLLAVSSAVIVSLIWTVLHVKRHSYCNCLHRCNKWKVVCNYGSVVALSHVWPMLACLKGFSSHQRTDRHSHTTPCASGQQPPASPATVRETAETKWRWGGKRVQTVDVIANTEGGHIWSVKEIQI